VADHAVECNEAALPRFEPDNKTSRPGKRWHSWLIAFVMAIIFGLGLGTRPRMPGWRLPMMCWLV
jgi:hypothetical protein